jgi:hypothetical protein
MQCDSQSRVTLRGGEMQCDIHRGIHISVLRQAKKKRAARYSRRPFPATRFAVNAPGIGAR